VAVDERMLRELVESLGFGEQRSRRGLYNTGSHSTEAAVNWIMDHLDDADLDHPFLAAPSAALRDEVLAAAASVGDKMVLCVRVDLAMSVGKTAAQCSHATLGLYKRLAASNVHWLRQWERSGEKTVTLALDSDQHLCDGRCARVLSVPHAVLGV